MAKGPVNNKTETMFGIKSTTSVRKEFHPPVALPSSAWPHGFTLAFTMSNDQQPFGEAMVTSATSTN